MTSEAMVLDVSNDWIMAAGVQQRFMQGCETAIDNLDYAAGCRQVLQLGGDCYDFVPLGNERLAVTIGDASGKGLAAALMISSVQSSLRTAMLLGGVDLAKAFHLVNRQVYASSSADRYATLFCGIFDGRTCTLRYVNAGHNPPLVIRLDRSVSWLETGGAPVGAFPDWPYEEGRVQLSPGDLVVAYTDGITEAVDTSGKEWGVEGLQKVAREAKGLCADEIVHAIFTCMDGFSQGSQSDDATVGVLRVR
jgi:sigma-B regulation protein RsbU (phosphoserine phosphatase)